LNHIYREGDIIFFRGTGWWQRLYRALGNDPSEDECAFTRAAIVSECGRLETARIVEPRWWGFAESNLVRHEFRTAVAYRPTLDTDRESALTILDALMKGGPVRFGWGARLRLLLEAIVSERWSFRSYDPWAWLVYFVHRRAIARGGKIDMSADGPHRVVFWRAATGDFEFVHGEEMLESVFQ
jgi:hypothetical protein